MCEAITCYGVRGWYAELDPKLHGPEILEKFREDFGDDFNEKLHATKYTAAQAVTHRRELAKLVGKANWRTEFLNKYYWRTTGISSECPTRSSSR